MGLFNRIIGFFIRYRTSVSCGSGSYVNWWAMRGLRGGRLIIGTECIIKCRVAFDSRQAVVEIGDRCYVGASHLVCHTGIKLGNDVIVSWGVTIVDHDSHALHWDCRSADVSNWKIGLKIWDHVNIRAVEIGDKVWIGFGASILKGVKVGEGAIIGANSVVTHDVDAFTVVAGNPARVVRTLSASGTSL